MQAIFNQDNGDSFILESGLPKDYRGIILQNSVSYFHQSASALIIVQNLHRTEFNIHLGIYKFLGLVRAVLQPPAFRTGSLLTLKSDFKATIKDFGPFQLKKNNFVFLHHGEEKIQADFKQEKEYQLLDISWSDEMVSESLHHFEHLGRLTIPFKQIYTDKKTSLILTPQNSGEKILGVVNDLLSSPFDQDLNEIYFGYKIREYLLLLLMQFSKKEGPIVHLTETEKNRVMDLAERLQLDPKGKYPITLVAKELGMNEMKLKVAFKQIFGKGIFAFHNNHRMNEARRLLKEADLPIKQVASLVGYELTTSFITHFREHFGYPPSKIQKKS